MTGGFAALSNALVYAGRDSLFAALEFTGVFVFV